MDGNGYNWFNDMGYYIGYLEEYQKFLQARCDVGHAVVRHLDFLVDAYRSPGGSEAFAESEAAAKLAEDTSLMYVLMKYGVNERVHGADFDAYAAKTGSELYPDRAAVVRDRIMSGTRATSLRRRRISWLPPSSSWSRRKIRFPGSIGREGHAGRRVPARVSFG